VSESFWFLSSPYSLYGGGLDDAYVQACRATGLLLSHGITAFSPVAHFHPIAKESGLDALDHAFWMNHCRPLADTAGGIIVLRLNGWAESRGVLEERRIFRDARKPIVFMDPGRVPEELMDLPEALRYGAALAV
jgi:hypothetical protein